MGCTIEDICSSPTTFLSSGLVFSLLSRRVVTAFPFRGRFMEGDVVCNLILVPLMILVLWLAFLYTRSDPKKVRRKREEPRRCGAKALFRSVPFLFFLFLPSICPQTAVKELICSSCLCGEIILHSLIRSHWTWLWSQAASSCVTLVGELDRFRDVEDG